MKSTRATQFTSEMKFKNHLTNIKATLVDYTPVDTLMKYIPEFCAITWLEGIEQTDEFLRSRKMDRADMLIEMFNWRTLPTALETVRMTFFLEGLDLTNVTHIIRHRLFSFSAQSTDPATMEGHDILENDAFLQNPELLERSRRLANDANRLYIDALDSGMSFYDARHYQPRAKEAKYFMSGNIKDFIGFINTRLGRTNQPTSDNILALRMRQAILEVYPFLEKHMPPEQVQKHYAHSIGNKMNMNTFPPDKFHKEYLDKNRIHQHGIDYNHDKPRDEYECNKPFEILFGQILRGEA